MNKIEVDVTLKPITVEKIKDWLFNNWIGSNGESIYDLTEWEREEVISEFSSYAVNVYGENIYTELKIRGRYQKKDYESLVLHSSDYDFTIYRPDYDDYVNINEVMI